MSVLLQPISSLARNQSTLKNENLVSFNLSFKSYITMSSSTSSASSAPESAASKLRRMIEDPNEFIVGPGVHDGVSARIALETGFDVLYMVSIIHI